MADLKPRITAHIGVLLRHNLYKSEIADRIGVNISTVYGYANGDSAGQKAQRDAVRLLMKEVQKTGPLPSMQQMLRRIMEDHAQEQVADRIGVLKQTVGKFVKGQLEPNLGTVKATRKWYAELTDGEPVNNTKPDFAEQMRTVINPDEQAFVDLAREALDLDKGTSRTTILQTIEDLVALRKHYGDEESRVKAAELLRFRSAIAARFSCPIDQPVEFFIDIIDAMEKSARTAKRTRADFQMFVLDVGKAIGVPDDTPVEPLPVYEKLQEFVGMHGIEQRMTDDANKALGEFVAKVGERIGLEPDELTQTLILQAIDTLHERIEEWERHYKTARMTFAEDLGINSGDNTLDDILKRARYLNRMEKKFDEVLRQLGEKLNMPPDAWTEYLIFERLDQLIHDRGVFDGDAAKHWHEKYQLMHSTYYNLLNTLYDALGFPAGRTMVPEDVIRVISDLKQTAETRSSGHPTPPHRFDEFLDWLARFLNVQRDGYSWKPFQDALYQLTFQGQLVERLRGTNQAQANTIGKLHEDIERYKEALTDQVEGDDEPDLVIRHEHVFFQADAEGK